MPGATTEVPDARPSRAALQLPSIRSMLRHAGPTLLEGVVGPFVLFYGILIVGGFRAALFGALAWSLGAVVHRRSRGRTVPLTLLFGSVFLVIRTAVAVWTGNPFWYFIQPTVGTALTGLVFLISAVAGRPIIERLAYDFCPLEPDLVRRPGVRRFFIRLSFFWAAVLIANAATGLVLLLTVSVSAFVLDKALMTWCLFSAAIAGSVYAFVRTMRSEGVRVRLTWATSASSGS